MAERRVFTLSQVSQHKSNKDCWVVINGRVLDVTKFLEEHPGGEEVILEVGGNDATKEFDAIGHSKAAQNVVLKYQVGVLQGAIVKDVDLKDVVDKESNTKEMSAYVIKEDGRSKSLAFYDFVVPFLAAGLYIGYRCLTRADSIAY
ncbi:cytochrome b5 [Cajanus cajan]|uniref:Cytochrome b5 isoform 2 n=1 Tax=Cajanus cajan TaxID=3821 RepID=A0A151TQU7_CAJCA|nr:cytochrome b5 [Cajanus cajan]KYP69401.1 putative cytochrome b5 isoform 2 [Cajanus cajan]